MLTPQADLPESELVDVRMSRAAAEQLALACRWAELRAEREWDDPSVSGARQQRAMIAYEWLSWGSRWLRNEEAIRAAS
jgi:hypothetical protein